MLKRTLLLITALQINSIILPGIKAQSALMKANKTSFIIQLSDGKKSMAKYSRTNQTLEVTNDNGKITLYSNVITSPVLSETKDGQPYIGLQKPYTSEPRSSSGKVKYYYGTPIFIVQP